MEDIDRDQLFFIHLLSCYLLIEFVCNYIFYTMVALPRIEVKLKNLEATAYLSKLLKTGIRYVFENPRKYLVKTNIIAT